MADRPILTSEAGIRHSWRPTQDGGGLVISQADVAPMLEHNKAQESHNDGYSPTRELRRVASIPLILIQKWRDEEGWDAFSPECADKLAAKLNSSEYRYLRTAPGRIGVSNGRIR